jgi:DNA-binding CsgD family transcriptional regulator
MTILLAAGYYSFLLVTAVVQVFLAYNLQKKYPVKYLSDFFYYLITVFTYWFVIFVLGDLFLLIVGSDFDVQASTIRWIFIFFSFPFIIMALYFFLLFFCSLRDKFYSFWKVLPIFIPLVILIILMGIYTIRPLDQINHSRSADMYSLIRIYAGAFRFVILTWAFFSAAKIKDRDRKELTRVLSVYYFVIFVLYVLFRRPIPFTDHDLHFYFIPFIYLIINLPPLLILKNKSRKLNGAFPLDMAGSLDFAGLYEKYNLTKREQEIFHLLLEGKSNSEIRKQLYISIKTVKNHIYHLYKKMGVNSRTKLLVLVQNLMGDEKNQ